MNAGSVGALLLGVGYPMAVAGLVRLRHLLRTRDAGWFAMEVGGTAAIVAGWALRGRWSAVVPNAVWLALLPVLWWRARRRR